MSGSEPPGVDPRAPLLGLAGWLGTWAGVSGTSFPALLAGGFGGAALAVGLRWRRHLLVAVAAVLLGCLGLAVIRSLAVHGGPVHDLATQRAVAEVVITVGPGRTFEAGPAGRRWTGHGVVEEVAARGRVWRGDRPVLVVAGGALAEPWAAVVPGSRLRATVRLDQAGPDESFTAVVRAREPPDLIAAPGWLAAGVHRVRAALREAVAGLDPEPRALVPALVVGDTDAMDAGLRERFRVTGLAHLAAVSGANLTLLLASLLWLAGWVGLRGWWLRAVAVLGVLGFVALCHGEPSVLRAAAMGCAGLAGLGLGGRQRGLRQLSWAVVALLLIDPWLSATAGFALSVVATAGIICWGRPWTEALSGWLPRPLSEAVAIPVAAQLATAPLVASLSGQVSVVGIFANLVAGPLVGPTTVLGFGCAALAAVWPGPAAVLGWLAGWGAQALCWIAHLGALLPSAAIQWHATPAGVSILAGLSTAGFLLTGKLLSRPVLALAVMSGLVMVLARPLAVPGWPPSGWAVVQCDVGQGSATVVRVAPGSAVVVDTGPDPPRLERCLATLGVERVPLLVITHLHADHTGGLAALDRRHLTTVVLPVGAAPALAASLAPVAPAAAVVEGRPGLQFAVGGTTVAVVSALSGAVTDSGEDSSAVNDGSVVTRIETGDLVVLATGDIETAGQAAAVRSGADLGADVLIVPHHGSAVQSADLIAAVGAPIALIGVGEGNDYGHPAPSALRLLSEAGMVVHRTDTDGAVAVSPGRDGWTVTTERAR